MLRLPLRRGRQRSSTPDGVPHIYHSIKLCSVSQASFAIRLPPLPRTLIRGAYRDRCLTITRYPTEPPTPSD